MRHRRFAPEPASVGRARAFIAGCVERYPEDFRDRALLLVSELATSAVVHARTNFDVTVADAAGRLRVGVRDHGHRAPAFAGDGRLFSSRGLRIVEVFADAWGFTERAEQGAQIWFTLEHRPPDGEMARIGATEP